MRNMTRLFVVAAVLGSVSFAQAGERSLLARLQGPNLFRQTQAIQAPLPDPTLQPEPEFGPLTAPAPQGYSYPTPQPYQSQYPGDAYPGQAYPTPAPYGYPVGGPAPRVKIEDPDHIAPCAVQRTIFVPDPCAPCRNGCDVPMVPVTICVPPCACEDYCSKKDGCYQKFDYGNYEVEVRVKDGYVEVDYDD